MDTPSDSFTRMYVHAEERDSYKPGDKLSIARGEHARPDEMRPFSAPSGRVNLKRIIH